MIEHCVARGLAEHLEGIINAKPWCAPHMKKRGILLGYSVLYILFPPYCLLPIAMLLGISFAAAGISKGICVLRQEDIATRKGTLTRVTFALWAVSVGAWYLSLITMLLISYRMPFFDGVHSEWGIAHEHAYGPAAVYIGCWMLLYAVLQTPAWLFVKRKIASVARRFFGWHLLFSTAILTAILCAVYLTGQL